MQMKMRFHLGVLSGLTFILFLPGCVEVIDFDTDRTGGQLVVDGKLVTGEGPFELYLGRTAATERKTTPVEGARISLFDDQGNMVFYRDQGDGKYLIPSRELRVKIGNTYYIQIELHNGEVYESERETVPPILGKLDSLHFGFGEIEELNEYGNTVIKPIVNAMIDLSLEQGPEQSSFFRFEVEEVYLLSPTDFPDPFGAIPPKCYIYTYPDLSTAELLAVNGDRTRNFTGLQVAAARLDYRFDEKHYFNIYLRSLTENAYVFWDQIDQTLSTVGTIFDTPPAPVQGNIFNVNDPEDRVLGYFSAVSSDSIRSFLLPSDLPILPYYECRYSPVKNEYPPRCIDCIDEAGASYQKPDYF